ncbi:hypothetical protein BJX96DRAFT_172493 [Aspergillus floccosus]
MSKSTSSVKNRKGLRKLISGLKKVKPNETPSPVPAGDRDDKPVAVHQHSDTNAPSQGLDKKPTAQAHSPGTQPNKDDRHDETDEWGDLWEKAYEQLSDEEKAHLNAYRDDILNTSPSKGVSNLDRDEQLQDLVRRNMGRLEDSNHLELQIGSHSINIQNEFRRMAHGVIFVKDVVSSAVSSEPHASLAWAGVLMGLNLFLNPIAQEEKAANGLSFTTDLMVRYRLIEQAHREEAVRARDASEAVGPLRLKEKIVFIYADIWRFQIRFARVYFRSSLHQFLRDMVTADDWESILDTIKEGDTSIMQYVNTKSYKTIQDIRRKIGECHSETFSLLKKTTDHIDGVMKTKLWDRLQPRTEAHYNSRIQKEVGGECLEGTQVPMLQQIQSWMDDPNAPHIFWLHGMAGTGKSTIARTVAAALDQGQTLDGNGHLDSERALGGSFFFRRTNKDREYAGALIHTLAAQLLYKLPGFAHYLQQVFEKKSFAVVNQSLCDQWNDLVLVPLKELGKLRRSRLVIFFVVDALDESQPELQAVSGKPNDIFLGPNIKDFVELLGQVGTLKEAQIQVRIFITSRPTEDIGRQFGQLQLDNYSDNTLLKIPLPKSDSSRVDDISRFVKSKLAKIRTVHQLEQDWPGEATVYGIVRMADGLFIFAATACLFLQQGDVHKRLKMIFQKKIEGNSPQNHLDQLYQDVLKAEVTTHDLLQSEKEERVDQFKAIVGSIVVLSSSLSVRGLSNLISEIVDVQEDTRSADGLQITEKCVEHMLSSLHSVLAVADDTRLIEMLHLSFPEFLVDRGRCGDMFWIDKTQANRRLFQRCVDIMSVTLERDLCRLYDVGTLIDEVPIDRLNKYLPEHVQYACCSWVDHLRQSDVVSSDNGKVHDFLKKSFIFWVEAMSLMRKMPASIQILNDLLTYVSTLPVSGKVY